MKRLLLPLLAAIALPTAVNANVDPRINQICMSASDYKGCVELYTEKFTLPKCNTFRKTKCTGEIKYTNATYVGEKSNEKEHGFGTLYWNNGNRYVGQLDQIDSYKGIKGPKNYKGSALHKNIVGMAKGSYLGVSAEARLLGLPEKEIQLIDDTAAAMKGFGFDIAGDHTDIKGLMKNFPNIIPVFPLTGVIYFPKTNLPLNIFEQRYLNLVNDAYKDRKSVV